MCLTCWCIISQSWWWCYWYISRFIFLSETWNRSFPNICYPCLLESLLTWCGNNKKNIDLFFLTALSQVMDNFSCLYSLICFYKCWYQQIVKQPIFSGDLYIMLSFLTLLKTKGNVYFSWKSHNLLDFVFNNLMRLGFCIWKLCTSLFHTSFVVHLRTRCMN